MISLAVVAAGWMGATAGLALDRVGGQTDRRGYVEVDAQLHPEPNQLVLIHHLPGGSG